VMMIYAFIFNPFHRVTIPCVFCLWCKIGFAWRNFISFLLSASARVPVVDVDVGEDDWRRRLTFVSRRKHFAFRLVKSVLTRRWFKRVRATKHRVPCRNQLLEVSLQLVET